jgi:hypothetical protein
MSDDLDFVVSMSVRFEEGWGQGGRVMIHRVGV